MPVYSYKCVTCGFEKEAFHRVAKRNSEKCCGKKMDIQITAGAKPVVLEGYDEITDMYFTGPKQKARAMREKGLVEY